MSRAACGAQGPEESSTTIRCVQLQMGSSVGVRPRSGLHKSHHHRDYKHGGTRSALPCVVTGNSGLLGSPTKGFLDAS